MQCRLLKTALGHGRWAITISNNDFTILPYPTYF